MKEKKPFWETVVGKILTQVIKIGASLIVKNQKPIKGNSELEKKVDEIFK